MGQEPVLLTRATRIRARLHEAWSLNSLFTLPEPTTAFLLAAVSWGWV